MSIKVKATAVLRSAYERAGLGKEFKLLVVARPRSGFTLHISILNRLLAYVWRKKKPLESKLQAFIPQASEQVYQAIVNYLQNYVNTDDLIFSEEFRLLVGGPKWLSKENQDMVCVRKYVGIKGMGDFLLVISLPKFTMEYHPVIHSHEAPSQWLEDPYYREYSKFTSISNPLEVVNASVFSINALTSEYIQRYIKEDNEAVRERLALYKLTDLNFFEGLLNPLLNYWKEFIRVKDYYYVTRWEDLITEPEKTIRRIASNAGIRIPEDAPRTIWEAMSYTNLPRHHKHHFWKGVIGNWKNYLVNEHLDIFKNYGFDEFLEAFGYEKIKHLNKKDYTPFQKKVAEYISKGNVCEYTGDTELFTFAFNKSNFRSTKFDFSSYPGRDGVYIERSTIKDEQLFNGLIDTTVEALKAVNESLNAIYARYGP
ncbi:sulfotransferase domain-containing protein [Chloroflexota bacterium]